MIFANTFYTVHPDVNFLSQICVYITCKSPRAILIATKFDTVYVLSKPTMTID